MRVHFLILHIKTQTPLELHVDYNILAHLTSKHKLQGLYEHHTHLQTC